MLKGLEIPIFVINLPNQIERRKSIELHLRRNNLTASFVDAIEGAKLSIDDWNNHYDYAYSKIFRERKMTPGRIWVYS